MKERNQSIEKKRWKHIPVLLFVILLSILVLIILVRNSEWYHDRFDYDAVAFGKFLKKEKLDTGITRIQSAYLVDESGQEVKLELPMEFWIMITNDFTFSWGKAIKYRIHSVSQPEDDFKNASRHKIMEFEIVLSKFDEPILVKIYKEGYLWTSLKTDSEFMIGSAYSEKYYKEGIKFICMEDE